MALAVGTTVKLARALWTVPLSVGTAMVTKSKARIQWSWFIVLFCLAAVAFYPSLKHLGVIGLTVTFFLIGTGLSKRTLQEVGVRPLLQGVFLCIIVAVGSLSLIRTGWIHLELSRAALNSRTTLAAKFVLDLNARVATTGDGGRGTLERLGGGVPVCAPSVLPRVT